MVGRGNDYGDHVNSDGHLHGSDHDANRHAACDDAYNDINSDDHDPAA